MLADAAFFASHDGCNGAALGELAGFLAFPAFPPPPDADPLCALPPRAPDRPPLPVRAAIALPPAFPPPCPLPLLVSVPPLACCSKRARRCL
eukprot:scaffold70810_cov23-Tisochrysis_lutea.AAC.2